LKKIRVLVVEDSAMMRRLIGDIIRSHPELDLMATARDGLDAIDKIRSDRPDVVTMDLEMPRLDGIETLRRIMAEKPLPVIMISSHTKKGNESTMKALEAGAIDFIAKPAMSSIEESIEELRAVLPQKILAAATARVDLISSAIQPKVERAGAEKRAISGRGRPKVIVAIGSSTGGPKALESVFNSIPADLPASVLVSQHMPPGFTLSFSQRLNTMSPLEVKEAEDGDLLQSGLAMVAPGGYHMIVKKGLVRLDNGPKVNYVKPSIDVMLESLVDCEQKVLVVIMTGMGKDGAAGAAALKKAKKDTVIIAQDPATALIASMPEALIKSVSCDAQVRLEKLAMEIDRYSRILF
jgi:two-component system, chemotaxis family, protein-glutamate methylesterase/glutaminase